MKVTVPTKAQVLCPVFIFRNKSLSRNGRLGKEKERRDQYSFSFKFCREIIANYILPLLLTNMGQRPRMEKIKSLQEILSKGNNNLNHRTLAGRRDLEGHQERSKIMILVRKLDTTLQSSKTVRFQLIHLHFPEPAGVRSGMGSGQNPCGSQLQHSIWDESLFCSFSAHSQWS